MKLCFTIVCWMVLVSANVCAANQPEEEFARILRQTLKQHPEIILDFLREESESVLDIAQQGSNLRRKKNMENQWREDLKENKKVAAANRPILGNPDAPVSIVAFSDFTCQYCRQAAEVLDRVIKTRPNDIKVIFKHLPHGKDTPSRLASEYFVAASFQDDKLPWLLYRKFFAEQEKLIAEAETFTGKAAEQAGLNMKKLTADLKNKKTGTIIEEDMADAKKLNIEGTPYFLVNNLVVRGAVSYDLFNAAVDMALAHSKK